MVTMQTKTSFDTTGWDLGGRGVFNDDVTIKQNAGRSTGALLFLTILAMEAVAQKMVPLTDLNPNLTSASLACGVNGGVVAAYQAADAEFAINIDGTLTDIQVDMTAIVALTDIASAINTISVPLGVLCSYNEETNTFYFSSLKQGLPASTITVLTAVSGGSGTDISGATHLNGLTAVGTVTAATGEASTAIPAGILGSDDITQAAIVAGDVDDVKVFTSGEPKYFNEEKIVLENSLTLDDVIPATGKTIRYTLYELGLVIVPTSNTEQIAPVN